MVLSPLQFSYEAAELRLPVRLGLLNAPSEGDAKQDLIVYVLHQTKRFEVANYPNVFIPTNLEVLDRVRDHFGMFYAELFDETLRKQNNRAVVTEYAWSTGSCDPCPQPPLTPSELHTLGASRNDADGDWVVTRLHTRYDKLSLSEDLVFRGARPAIGGRADRDDFGGPVKATVSSDEYNNFQGRYIIRHHHPGRAAASLHRVGVRSARPAAGRFRNGCARNSSSPWSDTLHA